MDGVVRSYLSQQILNPHKECWVKQRWEFGVAAGHCCTYPAYLQRAHNTQHSLLLFTCTINYTESRDISAANFKFLFFIFISACTHGETFSLKRKLSNIGGSALSLISSSALLCVFFMMCYHKAHAAQCSPTN